MLRTEAFFDVGADLQWPRREPWRRRVKLGFAFSAKVPYEVTILSTFSSRRCTSASNLIAKADTVRWDLNLVIRRPSCAEHVRIRDLVERVGQRRTKIPRSIHLLRERFSSTSKTSTTQSILTALSRRVFWSIWPSFSISLSLITMCTRSLMLWKKVKWGLKDRVRRLGLLQLSLVAVWWPWSAFRCV